ncbi:hypothetical protein AVEN_94569-1 [Araneus ventricosus]|uniref:RNase H type-1 domain-containing protein n=1 Tax=Araneus ventricosus TaxID=182803 RepID=A0A4Y2IS86_ARAVE|nr:hypothetical protein AVEN_94569-1 [Araneus ventricosus]
MNVEIFYIIRDDISEVMARKPAVEYIIEQQWDNCTIASDSRSDHVTLESLNEKRKNLNDIRSKIIKYDKGIKLRWVKAHIGQTGNERVDELAKLATKKLHVDFHISFFLFKISSKDKIKEKSYGHLPGTMLQLYKR